MYLPFLALLFTLTGSICFCTSQGLQDKHPLVPQQVRLGGLLDVNAMCTTPPPHSPHSRCPAVLNPRYLRLHTSEHFNCIPLFPPDVPLHPHPDERARPRRGGLTLGHLRPRNRGVTLGKSPLPPPPNRVVR